MKAGSVGFVEDAAERVGLFFFRRQEGWCSGFIVDARASKSKFFEPSCWDRCLQARDFGHVEFQGVLEDAQNWFVGSANIKTAFHQIRVPGWLQASFALPAVLAFEVAYTGQNGWPKTSCSRFFDISCSTWAMFFLSRCHGSLHAHGKC